MAGDDVTRKKPDPLIYNLAREKVGLPASKCVVVEDSLVGLRAAVGADMPARSVHWSPYDRVRAAHADP
jgi:HAD superfamily hydrolase (TIGR01509 family)